MSKQNSKIESSDPVSASAIDWSAADAAPMADAPDDDSPELLAAQVAELRPLGEVLPTLSTGKTRITIILETSVDRLPRCAT